MVDRWDALSDDDENMVLDYFWHAEFKNDIEFLVGCSLGGRFDMHCKNACICPDNDRLTRLHSFQKCIKGWTLHKHFFKNFMSS